jgi:C4-dicarboxylate transporter/malic acid transport protein
MQKSSGDVENLPETTQVPMATVSRSTRWNIVREFTPSWFTITMSTGSVATNIAGFPFAFPGQNEIGWAFWFLNCIMFVVFCTLLLLRFIMFPDTIKPMFYHPSQSLFMGCIPMSFSVIINGICAFWTPRVGPTATLIAIIFYFVNIPAVAASMIAIPFVMFSKHHDHQISRMSALWLLPIVPACVAAGTAGAIGSKLTSTQSQPNVVELAQSVLISGYTLAGMGFFLSLCISAIYFHRLVVFKLPPKEIIVSCFLPTGPFAMVSWAFLQLGDSSKIYLAFHSAESEYWVDFLSSARGAGGLWALLLWGLAFWWWIVALVSVGFTIQEKVPFNLGWWGSVFPTGVLAVATVTIGIKFDLLGFKVMGAILTIIQVCMWLFIYIFTAQGVIRGTLFYAPCLHQVNNQAPLDRRLSKILDMTPGVTNSSPNPIPDEEAIPYDDLNEKDS